MRYRESKRVGRQNSKRGTADLVSIETILSFTAEWIPSRDNGNIIYPVLNDMSWLSLVADIVDMITC